ncbi:MAG: hypothetical protein A2Y41_09025 [Spirochaetes bacterium GWB1_36_13]|nr:MAG: hypothetical protein A2Y41_09025 [Spirochaetes bacterium GWB1_36_13]
MKKKVLILCLIFVSLSIFGAEKQEKNKNYYFDFLMKPLDTKNQYIFYLPYLFMPFERAKLMDEGVSELKVSFYKSSTFIDYFAANEKGLFDLESTMLAFQYSQTIGGIEWRALLPFFYHGPGYLDPFIENFHMAFGLPNGGREYWASNQMDFFYQTTEGDTSTKIFHKNKPFYGIGDLSLFGKKEIYNNNAVVAISGGVKIPFFYGEFISSKTFDLGSSIHLDYYGNRGYLYATGGFRLMLGRGDYKKELDRSFYSFQIGSGIGFRLSDTTAVFMQFYFQTSPYKTGIKRLDNPSSVHSFGIRWQWDDFLIQLSGDEDSFTYAAPDISFNIQTEFRF